MLLRVVYYIFYNLKIDDGMMEKEFDRVKVLRKRGNRIEIKKG